MSAALSKSMIVKPEWSDTNYSFRYHYFEQVAEISPSMNKLN